MSCSFQYTIVRLHLLCFLFSIQRERESAGVSELPGWGLNYMATFRLKTPPESNINRWTLPANRIVVTIWSAKAQFPAYMGVDIRVKPIAVT